MKKHKAIPLSRRIFENIKSFAIINPSLTKLENTNIVAHKVANDDVRAWLVYNPSINSNPTLVCGEVFTYGSNYSSMYMDLEESWQRDLVSIAMLEQL